MGVIQITITASDSGPIPGIPATVSITTSEPSTVFYTLDGATPNTYSSIYAAPIQIPAVRLEVVLSLYATNGIDSSAVVVQTYTGDEGAIITAVEGNARLPHSAIRCLDESNSDISLFPFGGTFQDQRVKYKNPGDAGITVYDEAKPATAAGFGSDGQPDGYTNKPYGHYKFKQIYSTTNVEGEVYPGVGNLPANIQIVGKTTPVEFTQERSDLADKIFNPRALVCIQDQNTEDPTNPVVINRSDFSLEPNETQSDGNLLFSSGLDTPTTTGGFVNRNYNARTGMMTNSFYDNSVGRWIFSSYPYTPTSKPNSQNLAHMVFPRATPGASKVFQWHLFYGRVLM